MKIEVQNGRWMIWWWWVLMSVIWNLIHYLNNIYSGVYLCVKKEDRDFNYTLFNFIRNIWWFNNRKCFFGTLMLLLHNKQYFIANVVCSSDTKEREFTFITLYLFCEQWTLFCQVLIFGNPQLDHNHYMNRKQHSWSIYWTYKVQIKLML